AIHAGGPVRATASSAFTDGIHTGLLCAAGAALLAAIIVAVLLSRGSHPRGGRNRIPELATLSWPYVTRGHGGGSTGGETAGPAPVNTPSGQATGDQAQRPSPAFTRPFS